MPIDPDFEPWNPNGDNYLDDVTSTPSTRQLPQSLPQRVRKRVDMEVPSGRCLIENVHPVRGVQYAHCVAKKNFIHEPGLV